MVKLLTGASYSSVFVFIFSAIPVASGFPPEGCLVDGPTG